MLKAIRNAEESVKYLHVHPENSFEEYLTTEHIIEKCSEADVELMETDIETGVVAFLNVNSDTTVALRADIDAVPTDDGPRHLCGHDYHTASLLGAMDYLSRHRDELNNNVLFVFQPAEECTSGAEYMLDSGITEYLEDAKAIFGIHNRPEDPVGRIVVHEGYLMAEKSSFTIKIHGKTGHGGEPHKCVDPMVAAAAFISGANTIVARNVDPNEAAVCSVLSVSCGTPDNFVPEDAVLTGSIRSFLPDVHVKIKNRIEELVKGIMSAFNCTYEIYWDMHVPSVNNRSELYKLAYKAALNVVDEECIIDTLPALGSDDFAVFGRVVPGFYYWVGSGRYDGKSAPWHKKEFKVEDGYLDIAVKLLVESAMMDVSELC